MINFPLTVKRLASTAAVFALLAWPLGALVAQESMSSSNYSIQSDVMNSSGSRSTSASYIVEDSQSSSGTGDSSSANYQAKAGFHARAVDAAAAAAAAAATGGGASGYHAPTILNLSITRSGATVIVSFDTTSLIRSAVSWGIDTSYTSGSLALSEFSIKHRFLITSLDFSKNHILKITLTRPDGYSVTVGNIPLNVRAEVASELVPNISNFSAVARRDDIALSWILPQDLPLASVRIVRSETGYVYTPLNGELIYEGLNEEFVDTDVRPGTRYYYTAFAKNDAGQYSSGVVASAILAREGEALAPEIPFEDIEVLGDVDPIIAGLSLKDFLFIQHGESIRVRDDTVTVNGKENLTVALRSYKVPAVLKTIAVTLVTQEEKPSSFTFILRANQDNTRFEAVVAPLGDTETYILKVTILDFKNQGLRKLGGSLVVLNPAAAILAATAQKFFWLGLILLLLSIAVLIYSRKGERVGKGEMGEVPQPQAT